MMTSINLMFGRSGSRSAIFGARRTIRPGRGFRPLDAFGDAPMMSRKQR
jgi:hypothetical protein